MFVLVSLPLISTTNNVGDLNPKQLNGRNQISAKQQDALGS